MPNVGYATLQIIPSIQGIGGELRRQLVGPAGDAGQRAGEAAGGGLGDKLKMGAAAAGVAAGALLVQGLSEAMGQMNTTSILQAQLGATGKDAARYGRIAGELYAAGITTDIQQGADTIRAVINAGLAPPDATNKQLTSIAAKMSDVATTFGTDMSMQTQAVSAMMKNGLAPSASAALDVITVGMQKLGPNAEDLLETFQEYPVQLKKLGVDSKMALGLFQQGLQGGARDTDIIADSLKEFSIRAIDMSTSSQDAYKLLGLSAEDMSAKIAKGGKGANQGLQLVLDKLRGIKDPVKQNAAAVGLFGTQAEELGTALFKLDPGKAAAGFGSVSGAAGKLGTILHSGPSHEITVFTRTLKQGFVDFLGGQVLPIITNTAHWLNDNLGPAVSGVGSAFGATAAWFKEWGIWLTPLGLLIGGLALALNASAIASGLSAAATATWGVVTGTATAVTTGWAGAMGVLNAVMALNPFVLVAIALVALGAALVVAYQKSETFRAIVQGAWSAIQTAAMWAWNNALKPVIDGFMVGLRAVGAIASWLWNNVLSPVFGFIGGAAKILFTTVVVLAILPIVAIFKVLGAIASWLWANAIGPAFRAIGAVAMWLWNNGIKPAFAQVQLVFRALGVLASWLWTNAIKPAFAGIAAVANWLWNNAVKPVFAAATLGFRALGAIGMWLWNNAIKPAFSGIGAVASWLWTNALKPVFDKGKQAVALFGAAFGIARDAIGKAWGAVKDIAKKPVQFIVDTVYNNGIRGVWNAVAGAFGAPKLPHYTFARGGVLPGYTPGRDPHKFYSATGGALEMSGGEAIMRPEFTRAVGSGFVGSMNRIAKSRGATGVKAALAPALGGNPPTRKYADGGIFNWIGKTASGAGSAVWDSVKKGASWLKDGLEASARAGVKNVVDPLLANFPGADTNFGKMIRRIPTKILDALFGYTKTADKKGAGGIGGPRVQAATSWARTQAGKPYQWAGNGNPSWDCSGFMSAIESVLRGQKPHRRWATMAFQGSQAPAGWVQNGNSPFKIGITNAGVGHTAGTIGGVNVESRGGDGVVVGARARGYNSSLFGSRYGFSPAAKYDSGGWLQPGLTPAANATGQPEAVLTSGQWRIAQNAMAGGGIGDLSVSVYVGDREITDIARAEVHASNGQLIQVLNAGGGG